MKVNAKTRKTRLDLTLSFIINLFKLNLLWMGFTILGLGVAGFFPATLAALKVTRKWLLTKDNSITTKEFITYMKVELISGNIIGYLLTIVGIVLYVNYQLLAQMSGNFSIIIPIAFYLILFLYTTTVLWVFPLYIHRENKVFKTIKNALIIGILKLPITFALMSLIFILFYFSLAMPTMLIFFTFSILFTVWMQWSLKGLNRIKFTNENLQ